MSCTKKKNVLALNILLMVCAMGCLVIYDFWGGLWLKGVTSAWFVILGLVNLLYGWKRNPGSRRFLVLTTLGLFFGMCADVLLAVHFILGILSFATGHVLYLAAFYTLEPPRRKDLYLILPICLVSIFLVTGTPYIQIQDPLLQKLSLGYAVIISCMLGKALSNRCAGKSLCRTLLMLGSALFWFSDVMLAVDMFGTPSRLTWILCSYAYWPAQTILAHAMFHFITEGEGHSRHDA